MPKSDDLITWTDLGGQIGGGVYQGGSDALGENGPVLDEAQIPAHEPGLGKRRCCGGGGGGGGLGGAEGGGEEGGREVVVLGFSEVGFGLQLGRRRSDGVGERVLVYEAGEGSVPSQSAGHGCGFLSFSAMCGGLGTHRRGREGFCNVGLVYVYI